MIIRTILVFFLVTFSFGYEASIFGQSTTIMLEEVIDSSNVIVIGKVVAESTLSKVTIDSLLNPGEYGIRTEDDGNIYFVKVGRVMKGSSVESGLKIVIVFDEVETTERASISIKQNHKYLFFLREKIVSRELTIKYGLTSDIFYSPTFDGLGVIDSMDSKIWKRTLEGTKKHLAASLRKRKHK